MVSYEDFIMRLLIRFPHLLVNLSEPQKRMILKTLKKGETR